MAERHLLLRVALALPVLPLVQVDHRGWLISSFVTGKASAARKERNMIRSGASRMAEDFRP
jgi:hypothetical protein